MSMSSKEVDRLLGAQEVAERTGLGEDAARELIKRLKPVRIGLGRRQLVKVRASVLEKWMATGGDDEWQRSTNEAESGGLADETATASVGAAARSSATNVRPRLLPRKSSKSSRWTPINPATKPAR